jgi:hypothetical protein
MTIVNFSHPLTPGQLASLAQLTGQPVDRVIARPAQFDVTQPFSEQAAGLLESVGLTPEEWQSEPMLVNLPSLSAIAGVVLAQIHGRTGHFPAVIRLRPVQGAVPTVYEVAEVLDLQAIRAHAKEMPPL